MFFNNNKKKRPQIKTIDKNSDKYLLSQPIVSLNLILGPK